MNATSLPPVSPIVRDVAARGARVRFVEAGSGRPLVLLHDYLSSHIAWEDVLPTLAARFHVIAPDLPGFGESEKPPPSRYAYGVDAFAESIADVIAALGISRVSVCGHALGGAVALTLAANHAHLVEKLVLVSPLAFEARPDPAAYAATIPVVGPLFFKQLFGRTLFRKHFRDRSADAGKRAARVDYLFDLFNVPAAREAAFATLLSVQDTRAVVAGLSRVVAPTLVAWGRADRVAPVEQGRRLVRELRGARLEVLESGHSPPEECPEAFAEIVARFIAGAKGA
jgi:pimeloyl-ACP methyl ester carboxylesterase